MGPSARSDPRSVRDDAIRRLGRYQIIGRLATGGMAEVYLAVSGELPGFRTLVVVKRILPHLASNSQFIRMFLDESRLASLLDHPNIIRIVEVGHDGEDYFLAMELVQGKPLSAVLRKAARERESPSPALSAYIIAQAAHGLAYAHTLTDGDGRSLGIVHRDVSPQNVLISFEGAIKLIDFGVARAFGRVAYTSPGGLKGKIDYMSPEQASAEDVDHRADVFALGVVLWEVLTGRRLFRRETELATMRAIVDDPIPRPSEITEVPPDLEAIVMRALRKRRDARYPSAHEMAVALERYAFAQPGFTPMAVTSYVKKLFASEYLQWRKTATAALDMAVEPSGADRAALNSFGAEPATHGPTMALRPGSALSDGRGTGARSEHGSRGSRSQPRGLVPPTDGVSVASVNTSAPSTGDRLWVYGGLAILAAVAVAGAWILARPPLGIADKNADDLTPIPLTSEARLGDLPAPPAPSAEKPPARAQPESPPAHPTNTTKAASAPTPIGSDVKSARPADAASWKALSRPAKQPPRTRAVQRARARRDDAASEQNASGARSGAGDSKPASSKADPFED
jgi:eukaryotic-like serine/threonine-protein kinase